MSRRTRHNARRRRAQDRAWLLVAVLLALLAAAGLFLWRSRGTAAKKPAVWEAHVVPLTGKPLSVVWDYRPLRFEAKPGMDVQAPTWLYVQADAQGAAVLRDLGDLGYKNFDAAAYVADAHAAGVKIWATVVSFEPELSRQTVVTESSRAAFARDLAQWAEETGVDGICFDFEKMDPENKDRFTALVAAAKAALPGRTVAAAVTVPLGYESTTNWYQCYDRAGLARAADYLAIMAYDGHKEKTQPVAPLPWVAKAIERTLEEVPSDRVLLGVPFYGVDFYGNAEEETQRDTALAARELQTLLQENELTRDGETLRVADWSKRGEWLPQWGVYEYEMTDTAGLTHRIWMEGAESLREKGRLMERYGLAGVAIWRGSQGTEELWEALAEVTGKEYPDG